ncbi:hypothetical protein VT06_09465 [Arsukibacterium sp. MJ3]|uniref:hypothetical protein n=1 Tax=Arsukibacterium sp. MJ3 TaxID=1632859 RepID=UPI00062701A0|nr:hypothetical protein [Arsukibacterium sp. MJ3]KKO48954.1 hypothetical protein VT06_09465 [Arsukibacterium sp. MJ3]
MIKKLEKSIKRQVKIAGLLLIASVAMSAQAAIIVITPENPTWGGDVNSAITAAAPRNGNASLQVQGDRTRFFGLGNPFNPLSNIALLDELLNFSFEWAISSTSSNDYHPDYTPALRLHIWDNGQRSELIWEGAYNGVYGNISKDTWYQTSFRDNFYQWVAGVGVTEIYNRTLTDWQNLYSDEAYISSVSIGAGSGATTNYLAFADNLTLQLTNSDVTYNFELAATAVPEPAGIALFAGGLLLLLRRFRAK